MVTNFNLKKNDKEIINNNFTEEGKIRCQVCGYLLDNEKSIEYHNLAPLMESNRFTNRDLAPICKKHKRKLKNLSIKEYKTYLELENFFSGRKVRRLNDVLKLKLGKNDCDLPLNAEIANGYIKINLDNDWYNLPISTCPSTGYRYFYIVLPAKYINNDQELQPRPLEIKRVWELYRHLILHTQLTPSVCRLVEDKIYLFDGQHKTAAQLWAGRDQIECKVYIDPDIKILKETNLVAHDKLRQMPFFSSVLINKWADLFNEEWQEYMDTEGNKSEEGFISFLAKKGRKRSEALNMVRSNIYDSILEDSRLKITSCISDYSNSSNSYLTLNKLRLNIFKKFIAKPPLKVNIEKSDKLREAERNNLVMFLNILAEAACSRDKDFNKRVFLNGAFKAWSTILRDTISQLLDLYSENERKKVFLRELDDEVWDLIGNKTKKLFEHRVWHDNSQRTYENLKNSREEEVLEFLKNKGLTVNWILSDSGTKVNIVDFVD